jgi:hypothetical protein
MEREFQKLRWASCWMMVVRVPRGTGNSSLHHCVPTGSEAQWVPGAPSLGVKRQGHETDHSPPSSAKVKNAWSYTSTPPIRLRGVMLAGGLTVCTFFLVIN